MHVIIVNACYQSLLLTSCMIVAYLYNFLIDNIGDNVGGSGEICDDSSGLGRLCAGPDRYTLAVISLLPLHLSHMVSSLYVAC